MGQYMTPPDPRHNIADDLRGSPREHYSYRQMIAPMFDGRIPPPDRFFEVVCGDISTGGFSFYLGCRPEFEHLVVALGPRCDLTHLAARVVYVDEVHQDGGMLYRVGCCFTDRVCV